MSSRLSNIRSVQHVCYAPDGLFCMFESVKIFFRSNASDETIDDIAQPNDELPSNTNGISNGDSNPQESPPKSRPKLPGRKLTSKELEEEAVICSTLEEKISILKKDLRDKTIIFQKLAAELFRMLGLFERVGKLEETMGNQIVEAEQVVSLINEI